MSGKRLLDAAALYRATKSVASKHVALRTHQLEAYGKTSSLAKALKNQTDRITLPLSAASALARRAQESGNPYSTQASSTPIPSPESVQSPSTAPAKKEGLQQDHFYERSEQNSTSQPLPDRDIGIKQEKAQRYPLPDGSIPPAESKIAASPRDDESYSQRPQTEPVKDPIVKETDQTEGKIQPTTSAQSSIPKPANDPATPPPEEARRLQRQAERQIPSQTAEPPPTVASDIKAASNGLSEAAELGVDQEQDLFYTASGKAGQVLSALPRVKLPKNTVDDQHSIDRVPDDRINQDVFYSSAPEDRDQTVPHQQAIPQQNEPSEEMYSELFHSPKVAKMLKGKPKPSEPSKGLDLKGVTGTPSESDGSIPAGDTESFNIRPTVENNGTGAEARKGTEYSTQSRNSQEDKIEDLAADIASDARQNSTKGEKVNTLERVSGQQRTDRLTEDACRYKKQMTRQPRKNMRCTNPGCHPLALDDCGSTVDLRLRWHLALSVRAFGGRRDRIKAAEVP